MYYIILFVGVLSFLGLVAWLAPLRRQSHAHAAGHGPGQRAQTGHAALGLAAQLLKGERKEDMPCLTPIDCVKDKRCAGHCGYR